MAISKLILNGDVQMDVTSDTVSASRMLNGYTATKNDGTKVTGNIATKTATDLTASGSTVTVPGGYYATQVTKNVASTTHPNPTAAITSSTGVVTATHTQTAGYVAAGTTTGTMNLTTQAGKTVTPTETAQTAVASYRWTTGPVSVAAISSTYVGTGVDRRDGENTTFTQSTGTFYGPSGYYTEAFTRIITTQAAQTINTSTADQTVASNRWLTGTQTIKSVTTSNLTAANIAEGVTVKVGDANNASRITQVTGTHSGATSYTATINGTGNGSYCFVRHNGQLYSAGSFTYKEGDTLTIYCRGNNAQINGENVTLTNYSYTYTLSVGDITIELTYSSMTSNSVKVWGLVQPTGTSSITGAGTFNVYGYSAATVGTGAATTPATTITTNPTFTLISSTGKITASYTSVSSIIPTVTAGYVTTGTAGIVTTTGASTYTLTTREATTYNTSTADQTIASNRWLTGTQTIKSVTTSNLTAANIVSGVVVKVGDANNASRITQVTGTFSGIIPTGTSTITSNGTYDVKAYASASVSVAGGEYYDIYKAMATLGTLNSQGDTRTGNIYSFTYTSTDIQNFCNSLSRIYSYMFVNKNLSDVFTFNNVSIIYGSAFASIGSGNAATTGTTTLNFPSCVSIETSAFFNNIKLLSVSFPVCTSIGSSAFQYCRGLIEANFPSCVSMGESAFYSCDNLITVSFPACTKIGERAFQSCYSLTTASFPACISIYSYAFAYCSRLTTISFPVCSRIMVGAFYYCSNLTSASFPSCTSINGSAFYYCINLTSASFPSCTYIGSSAFMSCSNLTSINCLSCTYIGTSAFYSCSKLTSINCPACSLISASAFAYCKSLTTVSFPICTILSSGAFAYCSSLTEANFSTCELIYGAAFIGCCNLISLNLTGVSSVPTLSNTNAFTSTPLYNYSTSAGQWGSIYVPSSLYASFQTAVNWSNASIKARLVSV